MLAALSETQSEDLNIPLQAEKVSGNSCHANTNQLKAVKHPSVPSLNL